MDPSGNFFWQNNVGDSGMLQGNISLDNYIQSQQMQSHQQQDSNSPKSSPMISSSPQDQNIYRQQSEDLPEEKIKDESVLAPGDSNYTIGIVNPDAIEPKERSYTCRICQVTFPNKSAVTVHSKLHTDHQGKPYRCNFCGKGFSTNFYLKQHERIHSGQKPYKCPMCDNSFKQLSHVQQHVRTHTGVRPYKCHWPGCGKAFLQQSHLKSHEARHIPKQNTGVRPYKCHWPDCGKSFAQLTNLKSHVARHTPGKGKSRKGGSSTAKKQEPPTENEDESGSSFNLANVINQAAAAANIVPSIVGDDEAEIRPFLCPGCSKLYVREATFKKHLEECKMKLQMSITATASALGIDPPPMPSSATNSGEYDGNLVQISNVSVQGNPAKRPRVNIKEEDDIPSIDAHLPMHPQSSAHQQSATNSPGSAVQNLVKEEVVNNDTSNFVSRQHLAEDSEFKLPQVLNNVSMYNVHSTNSPLTLQNTVLLHGEEPKHQPQLLVTQQQNVNSNQQLITQNQMITTSSTQPPSSIPIIFSNSVTSSPSLILQNNPGKDAVSEASEHSTINQAAIRWQWDQPVPRLNFP